MKKKRKEQISGVQLAGLMMRHFLNELDVLVFGKKNAASIKFTNEPVDEVSQSFACYWPEDESSPEGYWLYLEGIIPGIEESRTAVPKFFHEDGALIEKAVSTPSYPEPAEILAAVAAHEVRHRFRNQRTFFVLNGYEEVKDPLAKGIVKLVSFMNDEKKYYQPLNPGDAEEVLECADEFDAKVIDLLVIHLWKKGGSLEPLKNVLFAQPQDQKIWRPT